MLSVLPGNTIHMVIERLEEIRHHADTEILNSTGMDSELARSYIAWSTMAQQLLSTTLHPRDIERLVTSRTHWALVGALDKAPAVLVRAETNARRDLIEEELQILYRARADRRGHGWITAAVLDTNVVLHQSSELLSTDWHGLIGERAGRRIRVVVPIVVVDELDRLKRSQGNMQLGSKSVPRRSIARRALRVLDELFRTGGEQIELQFGMAAASAPSSLELLMDPLDHQRLENVDAEIRDRAQSLETYVNRTVLLTHDLGNALAARWAGLEAIRLPEPPETAD